MKSWISAKQESVFYLCFQCMYDYIKKFKCHLLVYCVPFRDGVIVIE